jgi:PhzF family phenazine biosynthesis protein
MTHYTETMDLPLYQIDAFASAAFRGNPAAVCPLDRWLPDETMQNIAAENNLAETAFYVPKGDRYGLRWFTPTVEVDLCGHATLATASVILDIRREIPGARVVFESRSGELAVERDGDLYALDFPARPPVERAVPGLEAALGAQPSLVLGPEGATDCLCVFETQAQVQALRPAMDRLAAIDCFAFVATAPGIDCDFVSRFFAPAQGIPEDPVTGRAHTTLIPYWSRRLGKKKMFARQISRRGGELWCEDRGARVRIAGRAIRYLEGMIHVPVTDS